MRSTLHKAKLAGALVGVTVAVTIAAPVASAMPIDPARPSARSSHTEVAPPPSSIAVSAGEAYEELRASGTQGQATDYSTPIASQPAVGEPSTPGGFDLVSAVIGAVAAAGLALVSMAALGMRRSIGRRAASA
jgi:hypothetical protein